MLLSRKRQVVLHPDDAGARVALGEALLLDGQHDAAVAQLEKALALAPADRVARRMLARTYLAQERLTLAERTLLEAVERDPEDAEARFELAELLVRVNRPDDALLQLAAALPSGAGTADRWLDAGELARSRGLFRKAREFFERARKLDPQNLRARDLIVEIGVLLDDAPPPRRTLGERGADWLLGRLREQLVHGALRGAVEDPAWQPIVRELRRGEPAALKRALVTAPSTVKEVALFQLVRGEVLLASGDLRGADAALERAVALADADAVRRAALLRRAEIALDEARYAEAARLAEAARPEDPEAAATDEEAAELIGDARCALGDSRGAVEAWEPVVAARPAGSVATRLHALRAVMRGAGGTTDGPRVGALHALAWNAFGGSVSVVEAVALPGSAQVVFTGNVGRIGRESAQVAVGCARAQVAASRAATATAPATADIHLHFGDFEQRKDGPSAGLPLALAVISALRGAPLRASLAATGQLSLHGSVEPIGGLHEKLIAAHLEGIRRVLVPRKNLLDLYALSRDVTSRLEILPVGSLDEALDLALAGPPEPPGPRGPVTP